MWLTDYHGPFGSCLQTRLRLRPNLNRAWWWCFFFFFFCFTDSRQAPWVCAVWMLSMLWGRYLVTARSRYLKINLGNDLVKGEMWSAEEWREDKVTYNSFMPSQPGWLYQGRFFWVVTEKAVNVKWRKQINKPRNKTKNKKRGGEEKENM